MHSHGGPWERGETTLSAFGGMGLGGRAPKIGGLSPRVMFLKRLLNDFKR